MKKRSELRGKKTSIREQQEKVEALFTNTQPELTVRLPDLNEALANMVETTFTIDDPEALYSVLERALEKSRDALTPNVLREALADAPRLYREAHRLYVVARIDYERFESEYTALLAAMREKATRELQREKQLGARTKQITDADVTSRVADMYPDEFRALTVRKVKADKMVEHLKHMVEVFKARGFALRALVGSKEEL